MELIVCWDYVDVQITATKYHFLNEEMLFLHVYKDTWSTGLCVMTCSYMS